MSHTPHNPKSLPRPIGNYTHAMEVQPNARYLFVSGQIPGAEDNGDVPATFEAQCEAVWHNILLILASANMSVRDIVKVTTYLTHPDQADANGEIRRRHLGAHAPAVTVIIAQLLQSKWMLEIELIAAKSEI
jgi:2-iminobutanoate/2-iminopropanoate deaminase